jgi:hypothetical protein
MSLITFWCLTIGFYLLLRGLDRVLRSIPCVDGNDVHCAAGFRTINQVNEESPPYDPRRDENHQWVWR